MKRRRLPVEVIDKVRDRGIHFSKVKEVPVSNDIPETGMRIKNSGWERYIGLKFYEKETCMDNREKLLDEIFETALQNDMTYSG